MRSGSGWDPSQEGGETDPASTGRRAGLVPGGATPQRSQRVGSRSVFCVGVARSRGSPSLPLGQRIQHGTRWPPVVVRRLARTQAGVERPDPGRTAVVGHEDDDRVVLELLVREELRQVAEPLVEVGDHPEESRPGPRPLYGRTYSGRSMQGA